MGKSKTPYLDKPSDELLNKITKSNTQTTNKYFAAIIVVSCLVVIVFSYYEQHYRFQQRLFNKTKIAHSEVEKTINGYQNSLSLLARLMLDNQRYLDSKKVVQLLKLTYVMDDNIKLLPVTWHPSLEPSKAFSARGSILVGTNESLLKDLNQNPHQYIIYDQINKQNDLELIIVSPVTQQNGQLDKKDVSTKDNNLVGYLKIPIEMSLILQTLYEKISAGDLLKIIRQDNSSVYFAKQNDSFKIISSPLLENYQFANDLSFSNNLYKISIGQNTQQIISRNLRITGLRCSIILVIGGLMLFAYNYIERKKAKKLCKDNSILVERIQFLEQQLQASNIQVEDSSEGKAKLTKQFDNYNTSVRAIINIENQIKQSYNASLHTIQEHLLLKQYARDEELTPDIVKQMFANLYRISEDLLHNIYNRENLLMEVDLASIFTEVLAIFAPIIDAHSLQIVNKMTQAKIQTNELIFKQILISIFVRSLCVVDNGGSITIAAIQDDSKNSVTIEISDDGFGFNDNLLKNILQKNDNDLLPCMTYILLDFKTTELLVKQILAGDLKIINTRNQGNKAILLLPLEHNRADNVTPFPKIAAR